MEDRSTQRAKESKLKEKRYKNFVPFEELVTKGVNLDQTKHFNQRSSLIQPEQYVDDLKFSKKPKSKLFHQKNLEKSVKGQLTAYGSLKGVVDAHLHSNL